jgi:1-acyl-sn-glycerol-3-phosphate acyltransferase
MLRGLWGVVVFVVATFFAGLGAVVGEFLLPNRDLTFHLGQMWSRLHLWALGIRVEYEGAPPPPDALPCVFVANHQSIVDMWAVAIRLPTSTRFVAKKSLFWIPIFGWAIRAGGFIPIDRSNKDKAIGSLALAGEALERGNSVILFAEGTRSRDGRLKPFKKGPFLLALHAEVPVVPIAISGAGAVVRPGSMVVRPGTVKVTFLPPIDVSPYLPSDWEGLLGEARGRIAARLAPDELPQR